MNSLVFPGFLQTAVCPSPCTDLPGSFLAEDQWGSAWSRWSRWSVFLPQTERRTWSPLPQITVYVYISLGVDIKFPLRRHSLRHGSPSVTASYLKGLLYFLCLPLLIALSLISLSVIIMSAIMRHISLWNISMPAVVGLLLLLNKC